MANLVLKWGGIGLLVFLYSGLALAVSDGPLLTWDNPTEYTNGDPLTPADISGYNVQCIEVGGTYGTGDVFTENISGFTDQFRFPRFTFSFPNQYVCRLNVVDISGIPSGWAETSFFEIDPRVPNPVIRLGVE